MNVDFIGKRSGNIGHWREDVQLRDVIKRGSGLLLMMSLLLVTILSPLFFFLFSFPTADVFIDFYCLAITKRCIIVEPVSFFVWNYITKSVASWNAFVWCNNRRIEENPICRLGSGFGEYLMFVSVLWIRTGSNSFEFICSSTCLGEPLCIWWCRSNQSLLVNISTATGGAW